MNLLRVLLFVAFILNQLKPLGLKCESSPFPPINSYLLKLDSLELCWLGGQRSESPTKTSEEKTHQHR